MEATAGVAELEDAPGLGPGGRKPVGVRVPPPAHRKNPPHERRVLTSFVGRPGLEPGTLGLRGPCSDQLS